MGKMFTGSDATPPITLAESNPLPRSINAALVAVSNYSCSLRTYFDVSPKRFDNLRRGAPVEAGINQRTRSDHWKCRLGLQHTSHNTASALELRAAQKTNLISSHSPSPALDLAVILPSSRQFKLPIAPGFTRKCCIWVTAENQLYTLFRTERIND